MNTTLQAISDHIDEDTEEIRISIGKSRVAVEQNEWRSTSSDYNKDDDKSAFTIVETDGVTTFLRVGPKILKCYYQILSRQGISREK